MYLKNAFPIILLFGLVFLFGCSGATDIPIIPAAGDDNPQVSQEPTQDLKLTEGATYADSHQLWGYYLIEVSEDHQKAEVMPLREVAQHFNALFWLETSPCTDCVKILTITHPGGGLNDYGVQVKHPFPGQKQYTGFDVRGIAIFNAHGTFPIHNMEYSIRETGDGEVVNPDGYSHLYYVDTYGSGPNGLQGYIKGHMAGPVNPTGTLNAFKNYYSSENRHFFEAGDAIEVHYLVDPPNGAFVFGYAVDANWAQPQNKPVNNVPEDFGLNANSPEAYQVSVTVGDGLTDKGGTAQVEIWVYDWQGFSTIKSVNLEAPDLVSSTVDAVFDSMGSDYVVYKASIANELGAAEGKYDTLVAVEDTANENAPEYLDLTAYQIVTANVGPTLPNQPPVAVAEADKTDIKAGDEVKFDGSESYDPEDGPVSLYEWDLDGDGSFETVGFAKPSKVYDTEGDYYVDLKVWDSLNLTDTLDTKIHISVKADPCAGHSPKANGVVDEDQPNVMVEIEFTDISTDPDGFGVLAFFEWDLDGDHTNGPQGDGYETFNKNPKMTYFDGGDYEVYHRVTDMSNCVDEMDTPLLIEVNGPPVADAEADKYTIEVGEDVIFASIASDPDGNGPITKFEWDLDGDGEMDAGVLGPVVDHIYYNEGTFNIQHKVTDSKGLTDTLDTPIQITVNPQGDVVVHLSEEEAMNPVGAKYIFHNYYGSISGTSLINYLDFDGPWDFTTLGPTGVFYQNIVEAELVKNL